jgi:hypothetical protein
MREGKNMSALFDGRLARLLSYWSARRGDRPAPRRADIDPPLDIPDLLPILTLVDVLHDPLRFRYRLVGTAVAEGLGRDATGRFVDAALYGDEAPAMFATYERLATEIRPFRRRSRLAWNQQEWLVLDAIELPLVDDDDRVCMILGGNCFTMTSDTSGPARDYRPLDPDGDWDRD